MTNASDCNMGVGCQEAGVCYAAQNGHPEKCPLAEAGTEGSAPAHHNLSREECDQYRDVCAKAKTQAASTWGKAYWLKLEIYWARVARSRPTEAELAKQEHDRTEPGEEGEH